MNNISDDELRELLSNAGNIKVPYFNGELIQVHLEDPTVEEGSERILEH